MAIQRKTAKAAKKRSRIWRTRWKDCGGYRRETVK